MDSKDLHIKIPPPKKIGELQKKKTKLKTYGNCRGSRGHITIRTSTQNHESRDTSKEEGYNSLINFLYFQNYYRRRKLQ